MAFLQKNKLGGLVLLNIKNNISAIVMKTINTSTVYIEKEQKIQKRDDM